MKRRRPNRTHPAFRLSNSPMSQLVADQVEQRHTLDLLSEAFQQASVKLVPSKQELEGKLNAMLDGINRERGILIERTAIVNALFPRARDVAWFTNPSQELLIELHGLIGEMQNLHRTMLKYYLRINKEFASRGIAKEERKAYKLAADDLKELTEDLNERFFVFPQDEEFQDLMTQLNDIDHLVD